MIGVNVKAEQPVKTSASRDEISPVSNILGSRRARGGVRGAQMDSIRGCVMMAALTLATIAGIGIGLMIYKKRKPDIRSAYAVLEENSMCYASAMAHSYFFGYLNFMLPEVNHENPGISRRIKDYKSSQHLKGFEFPEKLFIIVTGTGDIPETFPFNKRIKLRKNLPSIVMTRSGITDRTYQTSVFSVKRQICSTNTPRDQIFVAMEGTPCLRHFNKSAETNAALRQLKPVIISTFMSKLSFLIEEDVGTRGKAEIVYVEYFDEDVIADAVLSAIRREKQCPR